MYATILTRFVGIGGLALALAAPAKNSLEPLARTHLPIGKPNSVDALKTFVEAEGIFSPGVGSCGVYFWVWNDADQKLWAPTMDDANCAHGLESGHLLLPWSRWNAGAVGVTTRVGQAGLPVGKDELQIVAAQVTLENSSPRAQSLALYVAVRPLGAAGGAIRSLTVEGRDMLLIDGQPGLISEQLSTAAGVLAKDEITELAALGKIPTQAAASSTSGDCSGALRFDLQLAPGQKRTLNFLCPVHPGRRVNGHRWDGVSSWAQLDLNAPYSPNGQYPQPAPGPEFYRDRSGCRAELVLNKARDYWRSLTGQVKLELPDPSWADAFRTILSHCAMNMNEGAPDVAVVNYNVFNRDGMYIANIFQKSGNFDLAKAAIDYFLRHPFNGRVQPEADNPGQILWVMGEQWQFTRDKEWLRRVYPSVRKIAAMIRYYRTTPGPHWVWDTSLEFGDALPADQRKELKAGACDGYNPAYTDAYDIAGLRAAALLAEAASQAVEAKDWGQLASDFLRQYTQRYGTNLPAGYGSYSVLWPCHLYAFDDGPAHDQFAKYGAQKPTDWRYFPLARSHQGLLAGNRNAGWETLQIHLAHPQMQGWYAFDEGGLSGIGNWNQLRSRMELKPFSGTTLGTMAMPHGWAIAEFYLLLRDALAYEDGQKLVLLAGIPEGWFNEPLRVENLPTHFGRLALEYQPGAKKLKIRIERAPVGGVMVKLPPGWAKEAAGRSGKLAIDPDGSVSTAGARRLEINFAQ